MNKKAKIATGILSSLLVLTACSSGGGNAGKDEKTLKIAESADIPTLDPSKATDAVAFTQFEQIYEGLYKVGKGDEIIPALAKGEPKKSDDGKTWTIKLRDDAKWSNGDPVTADDFVYSWRRTVNKDTAAEYAYMFENIKNAKEITEGKKKVEELGVQAVDKHTLKIELVKDLPYMKALLAFGSFLPQNEKFVKDHEKNYGTTDKDVIFNGPFKLENWKNEDSWDLVKNDKYYNKDKIKLEKVHYKVVKEAQTAVNMFESKDLDYVRSLTPENIKKYNGNKNYKTTPESAVFFLRVNETKNKDLANENLRKAIAKSIDRETFVKKLLDNGSAATDKLTAKGIVKEDGRDYTDGVKSSLSYDAKEAKAYYEKAKKELGKDKFEIEFLTYDKDNAITETEFMKAQIEKNLPGVTLKIKQLSFKQKLKVESEKNYDISYAGWAPDYPDPTTFLDLFKKDSPHNQTGYASDEYDGLLEKANSDAALKNPAERLKTLQQAEDKVLESGNVVPLYQRGLAQLLRTNVKGLENHQVGPDYSLDKVELK
ncbi:peptide ABC transporter substrate-binding protein [Staphylococcus simulans]|uniref:peptide ABC transporter substrate-binding protein n=1 Tax=Staphylococcus simulans TaxID=1286 RepID=UPI000D0406BD|nr:peptide ABC transporter substrate-binding protein [Staphylococcus simulans]